MFFVQGWWRMGGSIIFHRYPETKSSGDKNDHAFFFRREDESLFELIEFPSQGKFQFTDSSLPRGGTRA